MVSQNVCCGPPIQESKGEKVNGRQGDTVHRMASNKKRLEIGFVKKRFRFCWWLEGVGSDDERTKFSHVSERSIDFSTSQGFSALQDPHCHERSDDQPEIGKVNDRTLCQLSCSS